MKLKRKGKWEKCNLIGNIFVCLFVVVVVVDKIILFLSVFLIFFIEGCNQNIDRYFFKLSIFYCRFAAFRRCLEAEMKDSTRQGVSLQTKKEEKETVTDEDEEKFWQWDS